MWRRPPRPSRPGRSPAPQPRTDPPLPIDILLILQSLHIIFQISLVRIGSIRQGSLDLLDRFVEVALGAKYPSHPKVRSPIVREFFRVRPVDRQCLLLLLVSLQLAAVEVELQCAALFQRLVA